MPVSEKTALITGAASGIGRALTTRLLEEGWAVAALVRRDLPDDPIFASAITRKRLRIYHADLADAAARRIAIAEIAAHEPRLDLLFNNAGVATGTPQLSPQNRELHFEVNCIAPYVLADGLTPALAAANGRIVNTVSDAVFMTRHFDPETLAHPPGRFRRIIGPYASSKLALALWSKALAPSLAKCGVSIISVTPGPINTPLNSSAGMPLFMRPLVRFMAKSPAHGADLLLEAASPSYPSGNLVMKSKLRPIPFATEAERTLRLVVEAAKV